MRGTRSWSQIVGEAGAVRAVEESATGVRCALQRGFIEIDAISEACLKVTLRLHADCPPAPSFAVTGEAGSDENATVTEEEDAVVVRAGSTAARLNRNTGGLSVAGGSRTPLIQDFDSAFRVLRDGIRIEHVLGPDDHVYGLGEKTGYLDKRGGTYLMWNTDDPHHLPGKDPLYKSIPFMILFDGTRARGIFFDSPSRMVVDVGCADSSRYSVDIQDDAVSYYVFSGPTIPDVLSSYTQLTGRMAMPPKWALGFQQCRWSYHPDTRVREIAETFREKRIPCDAIYLDIDYMNGYRVFTWDPEEFPDPAGLARDLATRGFKIVTIVDPGVKKDSGYPVYSEGVREGMFARTADGHVYHGAVWPGASAYPDFTKEETRAWWARNHGPLFDAGVAGIWNDMNEPSDFSRDGGAPTEKTVPDDVMLEHDGAPRPFGRYHNAYGMEMCRATLEAFSRYRPDERPFILTRSAYAGIQRFAAVWTGDNHSWWEHVAMAMPMHLNVGLSGVAFVGGDIGGFSDNATGELFARWMQLGVFTPFCRAHSAIGTRPQEPWAFGEEVESICRRYVELRYRLLPFWYSEMFRAHTTGQPLMRPLVYAYPDDHRTYNLSDQFLVGDVFLVAPVYRPSSVVRAVYLPAGRWYEYWTDRLVEGGRDVLADAPIETLPLYVRAGSIVPTTEVSQFVGERPDTPLIVDVYPGANGEMLLYEDDGSTFGYRRGEYRSTRFTLRSDSSTAVLNVAVEAAAYDVGRDRWILRVHAAGPEGSVSGPTVQSVSYNARARIRECVIGEGDSTLSITV